MDYEKKYKEALEKARARYDKEPTDGYVGYANQILKEVFPELRESDNERIIKTLQEYVKNRNWPLNGPTQAEVLAYLEKQKINTEGDFGRGYDCGYEACLNSHGAEWFEKQKEQKHPNGCFTCDEYKKGYEEGRRNGFTAGYNKAMKEVEQKEQKPAEWSEEDVKRLYSIGTEIGFLKGRYSEWQKDMDWLYTLAEKMGFHKCKIGEVVTEWKKEDIDDKMLSKSKPSWSEEDEATYGAFICEVVNEKMNPTIEQVKWLRSIRDRLKSLRQQPKVEWSEEDEKNCNRIIRFLEPHKTFFPTKETKEEMQNWLKNRLKSLRPQPQGTYKQVIHTIFGMLKDKDFYEIQPSHRVSLLNDIRVKCKDAIECAPILDEPHWKPSEEHLSALLAVFNDPNNIGSQTCQLALTDLYERLKKLM